MFGEKLIIGHSKGKLDNKGRIIVPSFATPSEDDTIIIQAIQEDNIQALKIIAYKEYFNIIERLKKLRENADSLDKYQEYTKEIKTICFKLASQTRIDAQKRVCLPKAVLDEFGWKSQDTLKYDGLGDSLLISQNK